MFVPQSVEAPSGERLRAKRQVWCLLQVNLCDPCLSALKWFVYDARRYTSALIYLDLYWQLERALQLSLLTYTGKWNRTVDVAVKTLKQEAMSTEAFLEEAEIMHKLRHRKLVLLMGVCTQEEPIYIITELMSNGALLEYLRNDAGQTVKLPTLIDMAAQVNLVYFSSKLAAEVDR